MTFAGRVAEHDGRAQPVGDVDEELGRAGGEEDDGPERPAGEDERGNGDAGGGEEGEADVRHAEPPPRDLRAEGVRDPDDDEELCEQPR